MEQRNLAAGRVVLRSVERGTATSGEAPLSSCQSCVRECFGILRKIGVGALFTVLLLKSTV